MHIDESVVRTTLTHLPDYGYLSHDPLANLAVRSGAVRLADGATTELGWDISAWLLDALGEIARDGTPHVGSTESRYRAVLCATYLDGAPTMQLASQWAASLRTVERWRRDALRVYATLLADRIQEAPPCK